MSTKKIKSVKFLGCSNAQATYAGGADPRKLLEKGKTYDVVNIIVYDWHTHYYIEVNGEPIPFNSSCFGEYEEPKIELPKKLCTIIVDTENVFLVRIGTEPRTTDTGIANIIPIDRDISRFGRDRTIATAQHLVDCWNNQSGD